MPAALAGEDHAPGLVGLFGEQVLGQRRDREPRLLLDLALELARAPARVAGEDADADDAGIGGPDLTPWLLARVAELTNGAAVRANTALIVNNARVAAEIAGQLGRRS